MVFGCADEQGSKQVPLDTVDSNVVAIGDSTPAVLHLDGAATDTSYDVAMDSAGRTITPQDTIDQQP